MDEEELKKIVKNAEERLKEKEAIEKKEEEINKRELLLKKQEQEEEKDNFRKRKINIKKPAFFGAGLVFGKKFLGPRNWSKKNYFFEGSKGSVWWIFLALLLWFSDVMITGFNGVNINVLLNLKSLGLIREFLLSVWVLTIIFIYIFLKKPETRELGSFIFMVFIFYICIRFSGSNQGAWFHILFALFALMFLIIPAIPDRAEAYGITGMILFIDFFFFSLISSIQGAEFINRVTFPIWFFITLLFVRESVIKKVITILVILMYVTLFIVETDALNNMNSIRGGIEEISPQQKEVAKESFKKVIEYFKSLPNRTREAWQEQIKYGAGEYYSGKVDEKAKEELGVTLGKIESSESEIQEGEPITFWTNLKAQTLDKDNPINLKVECCIEKDNFCEVKGEIYPKEEFEVYSLTEEELDCNFDYLTKGSHKVVFKADFNFLTMAYLKTYFIEEERKREMRRRNIDIFKQYKIKDKNPEAIYTNGPVEIGIEIIKDLPIGLKKEDEFNRFSLGITLKNKWEGELKEIKDFFIVMPKETELVIENGKACGGYEFEKSSCSELNQKECDDNMYNLYKLKNKEGWDIEKQGHKSLRCNIKITDRESLLNKEPIAVKYFYVFTSYDYSLKKGKSFEVKKGEFSLEERGISIRSDEEVKKAILYAKENIIVNRKCRCEDKCEYYAHLIKLYSKKYSIDPLLVLSIIMQESSCEKDVTHITKDEQSCGLMQIPCSTKNWDNPETNIEKGTSILKSKKNLFKESCSSKDECETYATNKWKALGVCDWRCNNKKCEYYFKPNGKWYSGWKAAVRAYNGWGYGNLNYAEEVWERYEELKNAVKT